MENEHVRASGSSASTRADGSPAAALPERVRLTPPSGWPSLELGELWRFKDLLFTFAGRDFKLRYRQTALGVIWVVLQPLIGAGIFSFVFGNVAGFSAPGGTPYFVFTFVGMLAWNAFSKTVTRAGNALVPEAHLISKIYFPRLILPLSKSFSALIDLGVALLMLLILLLVFWHVPGAEALMMPVILLLLLLLALGIGFISSSLAVRYRDVNYVVPVLLQFLLYASPVAYATSEVPAAYRSLYYMNPLTSLLEVFRWSILGTGEPEWTYLGISAGVCLGVFAAGALVFKRLERSFADVV